MDAFDVVIAGVGVAAAATAGCLLRSGFRPLLLRVGVPDRHGAEALPPDARVQLDALGWGEVLARVGAVEVDGFENHLDADVPVFKPGPFLHVERSSLAAEALRWAIEQGAAVADCPRLPRLSEGRDEIRIALGSEESTFFAAIDATGRAAAWSRPLVRRGRGVADLFLARPESSPRPGRVVARPGGWSYRIDLRDATTVGVITGSPVGRPEKRLDPALLDRLGLGPAPPQFLNRRPCFAQWAAEPARGRRFAVGDAAFAPDPLAGQGLRLALAGAIAVAGCLRTLRDSPQAGLASTFYRDWVAGAVRRHLHFLHLDEPDRSDVGTDVGPTRVDLSGASAEPPMLRPTTLVRFAGHVVETGLNISGLIVPGTAIELPDGGLVRWLGEFDLLILKELAEVPIPLDLLHRRVHARGLSPAASEIMIGWCATHGLIRTALASE